MKKIITIALTTFLFSCGPSKQELEDIARAKQEAQATQQNPIQITSLSQGVQIATIDSCEYVLYPQTFVYVTGGAYNTNRITNYIITHKGNCKFCLQRKNTIK